jgi:hypothetical protein
MENDCAFANLEDKYTFKFKEKQKGRSIEHYLRTHTLSPHILRAIHA